MGKAFLLEVLVVGLIASDFTLGTYWSPHFFGGAYAARRGI